MRFQNDAERKVWSEAFDAGMSFSTGPHGAALFADLKVELMRSRSEDEPGETDTGSDHPSLLGAVRECMRRLAALEEREDMDLVRVVTGETLSFSDIPDDTRVYTMTRLEAHRLGFQPAEVGLERVKP